MCNRKWQKNRPELRARGQWQNRQRAESENKGPLAGQCFKFDAQFQSSSQRRKGGSLFGRVFLKSKSDVILVFKTHQRQRRKTRGHWPGSFSKSMHYFSHQRQWRKGVIIWPGSSQIRCNSFGNQRQLENKGPLARQFSKIDALFQSSKAAEKRGSLFGRVVSKSDAIDRSSKAA